MNRPKFTDLLEKATIDAIDFSSRYITNQTSKSIRYCVYLNYSSDDPVSNDLSAYSLFPEDNGKYYHRIKAEKVIDLLYRKNQAPVWIDISVITSSSKETTMNLCCAGRYSGDEKEYYYQKSGRGPFGVKSPDLPPGYIEGELFTIPNRYRWRVNRANPYQKVNWWRL